jgi:phosphoesterase RecJ-like protein
VGETVDLAAYGRMASALGGSSEVILCGHVDPDGDAVGSILGLALALETLGVRVHRVTADDGPAPGTYAFLPGFERFVSAAGADACETFVALDTPQLSRLGAAAPLAEACDRLLVLDHHPDAEPFGDLALLDAEAAAVGQMIWRLLPPMGVDPDSDLATCLYVSLVTDTGRFQYSNTTASVLADAGGMVEQGVDVAEVYRRLFESRSPQSLVLTGRVLSRLAVVNDGHVAWTWLESADLADTGARPEDTENLADAVRTVAGVDVVFVVKSGDDGSKVSLRAKGSFDVGAVARELGGGGHRAAAGFAASESRDAVVERLLPHLPGGQ